MNLSKKDYYTFTWKLSDLMVIEERSFMSNRFTMHGFPLINWRLGLYRRDPNVNVFPDYVFLQKFTNEFEVKVECELEMRDAKRQLKAHSSETYKFKANEETCWFRLEKCDWQAIDSVAAQLKITKVVRVDPDKPRLNLKPLPFDFYELKHCDVRLVTEDETFEAHKFVLATQSPFFDKMFSSEFKEQNDGEVKLNLDSYILNEALRYMYTGEVDFCGEISEALIEVADFLQMDRLKRICELDLESRLNLETCFEFIALAKKFNAESLKKQAIEYIIQNKSQIENALMQKLFEKEPELALEFFYFK